MRIEHFAFAVQNPVEMAAWYCRNLGLKIMRRFDGPTHTHFLGDADGHVLLEIYNNPKVKAPDYAAMDPLLLHLAFAADDVRGVRDQLLRVGAKTEGDITVTDAGDEMAMLRDPWGLAIQFIRRKQPMLSR